MDRDLFEDEFTKKEKNEILPVIKKGKGKLTSAQQEFNRLNKKIARLRSDLLSLPDKKRKVEAFYREHVLPVGIEYNRIFMELLVYWDGVYEKGELGSADLCSLSAIIIDRALLLEERSTELDDETLKSLQALRRKHEFIQSGLTKREFEKQQVREALASFELLTGYKATAKMKKAKTGEELDELIREFFENKNKEKKEAETNTSDDNSSTEEHAEEQEEKYTKRKMTQAELKRKQKEEEAAKSIRSIYMALAKTLHPDLETDSALRALKEERMKQLTEAYRNKDLARLLCMQVEWQEEEKGIDPAIQSNEIIKGYNKILRKQLEDLDLEMSMAVYMGSGLPGELCALLVVSSEELDVELDLFLQSEKSELESFKSESKSMRSKRGIKRMIREFDDQEDLDAAFGEVLLGLLKK
ncbi:MAG: J domain-containing protein [Parabacteroides sp.]|nr:J domain-containing protein [Parabacteroides sp.]